MTTKERIQQWTQSPFDTSTINEIKKLQSSPTELEDAFYQDIAFGTGGMRGKSLRFYFNYPEILI